MTKTTTGPLYLELEGDVIDLKTALTALRGLVEIADQDLFRAAWFITALEGLTKELGYRVQTLSDLCAKIGPDSEPRQTRRQAIEKGA